MKFDKFVDFACDSWRRAALIGLPQQTMALLGPPGIGKTSAAREVARKMQQKVASDDELAKALGAGPEDSAVCRVLDLSSMLPEDLNGLPRFADDGTTRFAPHAWLFELCRPGAYGVLCLDDLPAASPAMQVAARQISLERRVHDHMLAPGILVVVTGNRREDKAASTTLPSHFRNSVSLLSIEPDIESWHEWLAAQPGTDLMVSAYLRYRPSNFSKLPADSDSKGAFATPRTWHKLSTQLHTARKQGLVFELAASYVGEGIAAEFGKFAKIYNSLSDAKAVLDNPRQAVPDPAKELERVDRMYALTTAIADVAADQAMSTKSKSRAVDICVKFLHALAWVTQEQKEYSAVGVSTFSARVGKARAGRLFFAAVQSLQGTKDKKTKTLLNFIRRAVAG